MADPKKEAFGFTFFPETVKSRIEVYIVSKLEKNYVGISRSEFVNFCKNCFLKCSEKSRSTCRSYAEQRTRQRIEIRV